MRSLDTNVLARFFIDDPDDDEAIRQRPAAIAALAKPALITVTVMLEFEWVMRGFYKLPRATIIQVFRALAGIGHVTIQDRAAVLSALDGLEAGMDFADALHLAGSSGAAAFVTFDRRFAKAAKSLALKPRVEALD